MKKSFAILFLLSLAYTSSNAGQLANGVWSPTGCGEKPETPIVDSSSAEKFNRSIDAINQWQDLAVEYNSCLIKEANADSELIAKTANNVQAKFQKEIERVVAEADKARADLDN